MKKEAIKLKDSWEGDMEEFGEREGKEKKIIIKL